jgi:hypothetical protein
MTGAGPSAVRCPRKAESRDIGEPVGKRTIQNVLFLDVRLGFLDIFPNTPPCTDPQPVRTYPT